MSHGDHGPFHQHHHHSHHSPAPQREEEQRINNNPTSDLDIKGDVVKVYCEADGSFNLAVRGDEVVMANANDRDPYQQWIKDVSWGTKAKDSSGLPAFALVNIGSGKALYHPSKVEEKVRVDTYYQRSLNETVLWTCSKDVGNGWHAIRSISNIKLNLDVDHGTREHGGVRDGKAVLLFTWTDRENQHWRIETIGSHH